MGARLQDMAAINFDSVDKIWQRLQGISCNTITHNYERRHTLHIYKSILMTTVKLTSEVEV